MEDSDFAGVTLNLQAMEELCSLLKPQAGVYPLKSFPLILELAVTNIKDKDGNIIETIG